MRRQLGGQPPRNGAPTPTFRRFKQPRELPGRQQTPAVSQPYQMMRWPPGFRIYGIYPTCFECCRARREPLTYSSSPYPSLPGRARPFQRLARPSQRLGWEAELILEGIETLADPLPGWQVASLTIPVRTRIEPTRLLLYILDGSRLPHVGKSREQGHAGACTSTPHRHRSDRSPWEHMHVKRPFFMTSASEQAIIAHCANETPFVYLLCTRTHTQRWRAPGQSSGSGASKIPPGAPPTGGRRGGGRRGSPHPSRLPGPSVHAVSQLKRARGALGAERRFSTMVAMLPRKNAVLNGGRPFFFLDSRPCPSRSCRCWFQKHLYIYGERSTMEINTLLRRYV